MRSYSTKRPAQGAGASGEGAGWAHWQGCEADALSKPTPVQRQASPSRPGAGAHSSGRLCQPPPQLASQLPQAPTDALAAQGAAAAAARPAAISAAQRAGSALVT